MHRARVDWTGLQGLLALVASSALIVIFCRPVLAQDGAGPLPASPLETSPGANLYWHQPGTSWEQDCAQIMQTDWFGYSPRWYAKAEMQALRRDNLHTYDFATLAEGRGTVLSSASLDDEFRGGVRVLAGLTLSDWYRLEATYLGSYSWCKIAAIRNRQLNADGTTGNLSHQCKSVTQ